MPTVHRTVVFSNRDPMAPENVVEHIRELSNRLAKQDGGPAFPHAITAYRVAYQRLWDRFQDLQATAIPFMVGDECGEGVVS